MSSSASLARSRWPLAVLLASIGLTAFALIDAQRLVRSQQVVAERALREYASFAVWSYEQHLSANIEQMLREALGAVNHGDNLHTGPRVPSAADLASYLPFDVRCYCHRPRRGPTPESFFALQIGRDSLDVGRADHETPPRYSEAFPMPAMAPDLTPPKYTAADRRWIVDTLTRRIRATREVDHGFSLVIGGASSEPRVIAYTLMPTAWGDTMVYGAQYSPASLRSVFGDVLDGNGLLPTTFTQGRRNRDIVAVRISDGRGTDFFDSAPGMSSPLSARLALPGRDGALTVDALIRPELAGTLVIGGLPKSRLPFLFVVLGMAAALSIVAVAQLRREGELARLRSDFVSSVSHELRTPLAQIRLYAETIRLGRASGDVERAWSLGHIERETTRLTHLVENVLRFSALDRPPALAASPVDAAVEITSIVEEFRPLAATRGALVELHVGPLPPISLRADALRHIVLNLLDNAVRYGPTKQTVRVEAAADDGGVRIAVSDEGPGVASRERDEIWRPFARGGAAVGKGGSGIGLTIVRQVAEQHGGRAWVEDADGGGARFVVMLPAPAPAMVPA